MVTCEKVQKYPVGPSLRRNGYALLQLLTEAIGESPKVTVYSVVGEGVGEVTWTNK